MRCYCCDKALNEFESTRKSAVSGEFLDLCNKCFKGLGIESVDRTDLNPYAPADDDIEFDEDLLDNWEEEDE